MAEKEKVEELKEVLAVVSEKIPALLNSLTDVLYGKSSAEKYGQAVANFYKTLRDSGMTDAQAFELTGKYMSSLDLGGIIQQAVGGPRGKGRHGGLEDLGEEIKRRVDAKIKERRDEEE